ncbi:PREDICTED: peroxidase-like [Ceratosolen solmsi marchali]|uniref:Peroxidase-like n=1 Tax=Ceratosolen solmsi marchali TaxID=326594 RepID=A0AAJ6YMN9_9HYME|nr:PREDICTED: peroxidase-like [Ceratosolen solmsi marchali]
MTFSLIYDFLIPDALEVEESRYDYSSLFAPVNSLLSLIYPQSSPQSSYEPYLQSQRNLVYEQPSTQDAPKPLANCGQNLVPNCQASRYRSYDGSCNNKHYPSWGMANTKYSRLLPANYADNIHEPPVSKSGNPLPNARVVSYTLFPDIDIQDQKWTLLAMQWGQIMTHDMGMIDGTTQSKAHATQCCTNEGRLIRQALSSPLCYPILIPLNDPVYSKDRQQCRNFVRSTTDLDRGCSSGYQPAEQLTVVSHFLDLSIIYGSSNNIAASLRAGVGGRLVVNVNKNREYLPHATNKSNSCDISNEAEICYASGDARVNQNPQLTILHLMLHREHNRIAKELALLNPHWSDETIFQETRRLTIAIHQQISYYEWLPIFIGKQNSYNRRILYSTQGWVNDYDATVNPSTLNEHSNAAFRYFHSLIAGRLLLVDEHRFSYTYNALRLSDHFNRPAVIEEDDNLDKLTRGMAFQPQEASDQWFDSEITNYLFRNGRKLGDDLRAIDVQRNRDHGLATYNDYRAYAKLPKANKWSDFGDVISPENIQRLVQLYESPEDVDLTVGGSLERHVDGTLVGPTFLDILTEQFWRTRVGDRFWYETGDPDIAFTIEQLTEIRKASISRLFCDNGDEIHLMQLRGFEQVSQTNPLTRCDNIPSINLNLWKDIQTSPPTSPLPTPPIQGQTWTILPSTWLLPWRQ